MARMAGTQLTCEERDALLLDPGTGRVSEAWSVESSLTDPSGEFGAPRIETVWTDGERRVRDRRHPSPDGGADVEPCEHFLLEPEGGALRRRA